MLSCNGEDSMNPPLGSRAFRNMLVSGPAVRRAVLNNITSTTFTINYGKYFNMVHIIYNIYYDRGHI